MCEQASDVEDLERVFNDTSAEPIQISYATLKFITKNFGQVIGRGGFGVVYLGELRNGMVAVKKLSTPMDLFDKNFSNEFGNLIRLKHKNIVRFLGYCAESQGEMMKVGGQFRVAEEPRRLLCFEYVPNGNLQDYIKEKSYGFEWNVHYQIIKGICQGLHYLHQQRMNHLDLKPENVLLDAHLEPKITDFGMSRYFDGNISTMITKNLFGTLGYIAPEFIEKGQISSKSDIYSFGVITIKLMLGSNVINENWQEALERRNCPQMRRCIEIAQHCIDKDPKNRPSIIDILENLNKIETPIYTEPTMVLNEPRNDPKSSLYQIVQKFRELSVKSEVEVALAPILHVADKVEKFNPRVAYRCRLYAFEKAHCLDPTSSGRGVRQFKTALLQRIHREKDSDVKGLVRPSDGREMQAFYRHYYRKYVRALENTGDKEDGAAELTEAYQTAVVLFEVLEAVNVFEGTEVDQEIIEANNQIQEKRKLYLRP